MSQFRSLHKVLRVIIAFVLIFPAQSISVWAGTALPISMAAAMAKGQHEEMLESLARIEELLKKPPQPVIIELKCCEETKEILNVVRNIQTQTKEITMSLKDVEAKIDEVGTAVADGLAALNTTLQTEVQQIIEAIRAATQALQ
jgi:response regulator RpfG family c-di-GMP phosphodiesterase